MLVEGRQASFLSGPVRGVQPGPSRGRPRPRPVRDRSGTPCTSARTVLRYLRAWGTSLEADPTATRTFRKRRKHPCRSSRPARPTRPPRSQTPPPTSEPTNGSSRRCTTSSPRDPGSVDPTWAAYFTKSSERQRRGTPDQRRRPGRPGDPGRGATRPRRRHRPPSPAAARPRREGARRHGTGRAGTPRRTDAEAGAPGDAATGHQGGGARQGHRPPGAEGEGAPAPRRGRSTSRRTPCSAAPRPHRRQHGRLA